MKHMQQIRRLAIGAAGLTGALPAFAAAAPAAIARPVPPPPAPVPDKHLPLPLGHVVGPVYKIPAHAIAISGMPSWQIVLIAVGAAIATGTAFVPRSERGPCRKAIIAECPPPLKTWVGGQPR